MRGIRLKTGSGRMLKIVLIRPGSTDFDQQGRVQGTLDIPLSDDGKRQVTEAIGELRELEIGTIYTSPCRAASETARAIATALGLKVRSIDKLKNLDQGLWQGMLIDDVRTKQPKLYRRWQEEPESVCPPEGETIALARRRVAEAIAKLIKRHKNGVIGLVVPQPLASVVCNVLRRDELLDLWGSGEAATWETIPVTPDMVD